jgi:hypothetical protein
MLTELLGLRADGFGKRLFVRRPLLPNGVASLILHNMRVAGGKVSIRFVRNTHKVAVEVIEATQCEVVVRDEEDGDPP